MLNSKSVQLCLLIMSFSLLAYRTENTLHDLVLLYDGIILVHHVLVIWVQSQLKSANKLRKPETDSLRGESQNGEKQTKSLHTVGDSVR